jgi:Na+/melibiose symporter-like transporter
VRATWRMLAARRDLRLVLSAGIISLTGDWVLTIGLIYRVYAVTGSTVASALTMASSFAPQVLLGAVAGVFADRWDRKRTMIVANLLLAAGLLPLLLVRGAGQVWIVFAVMFAEGAVKQFFSPAEQAMVPRLVPDDELLAANALNGQVSNAARLAGSAIGGILVAAGGLVAVTLTDAASFAASAVLLTLVRASGRPVGADASGEQVRAIRLGFRRIGAELRAGLGLSARHRVLRALMIFALVTSVGEGIMSTLFTPFVEHVLHGSSQAFGLVVAAQAVGGIAGGVVAASAGHRVRASRLLSVGAIAFGLVDLAIFLYPLGYVAVWPAIAGMIIVGVPGALALAGLITLFQRNTEDAYRGRVFGAISTAEGVTVLAGTLGAGYLSRYAGIIPVLAIQGAGYVAAGITMFVWLRENSGSGGPQPGDAEQVSAAADCVTGARAETLAWRVEGPLMTCPDDQGDWHAAAHQGG